MRGGQCVHSPRAGLRRRAARDVVARAHLHAPREVHVAQQLALCLCGADGRFQLSHARLRRYRLLLLTRRQRAELGVAPAQRRYLLAKVSPSDRHRQVGRLLQVELLPVGSSLHRARGGAARRQRRRWRGPSRADVGRPHHVRVVAASCAREVCVSSPPCELWGACAGAHRWRARGSR
eukprot:784004-Prymnesium_polylepis.2